VGRRGSHPIEKHDEQALLAALPGVLHLAHQGAQSRVDRGRRGDRRPLRAAGTHAVEHVHLEFERLEPADRLAASFGGAPEKRYRRPD
jgi:hypothetical protein